jgi:hypothetical protein
MSYVLEETRNDGIIDRILDRYEKILAVHRQSLRNSSSLVYAPACLAADFIGLSLSGILKPHRTC